MEPTTAWSSRYAVAFDETCFKIRIQSGIASKRFGISIASESLDLGKCREGKVGSRPHLDAVSVWGKVNWGVRRTHTIHD